MKKSRGFTLIELLVVVLIIGILSAIAVPQYFKVVERGRFAEIMNYVGTVKGSQERYMLRNSAYYSGAATGLDTTPGALVKFTASDMTASTVPDWKITFTRIGTPQTYGTYVVTYTGPTVGLATTVPAVSADLFP